MTRDEQIISEHTDVKIIHRNFKSKRIKGLYCDGTIALSSSINTSTERACILAEEYGHHETSSGNIIDLSSDSNRKQEFKARLWAYNDMVGLRGLINAFEHHCTSTYETADFLDVTEEFLLDAIKAYSNKYGNYVEIDNYIILFNYPNLGVMKNLEGGNKLCL